MTFARQRGCPGSGVETGSPRILCLVVWVEVVSLDATCDIEMSSGRAVEVCVGDVKSSAIA